MNIRTLRGKWCVLSPCFPWSISTEYQTYPSLINYLFNDHQIESTKLLLETGPVDREKIIFGIKYLLKKWPRYKNYLFESPENLTFVNPTNPVFEREFNSLLKEAKSAIKKYRIKGREVLEKQSKLEMLGAKIVGNEAIFDYDAREQVHKTVYGIESPEAISKLNIIGKMISSYIYLFDKIPEFLISTDENPSIFYAMVKTQTEQIAKILCAVDVQKLKPVDNLKKVLILLNENIGYLWPYIIFPVEIHSSIKKSDGISEMENKIKYHIEYNTPFKNHIQVCLETLYYSFSPKEIDILQKEIRSDGTDSEENSTSVETLEILIPHDEDGERNYKMDDISDELIDKWIIDRKATPEIVQEDPIEPPQEAPIEPPQTAPQTVSQVVPTPQVVPSTQVVPAPVQTAPQVVPAPVQTAPQVVPAQVQTAPQVVPVQVQTAPPIIQIQPAEIIPWEKRFSKITQSGHVVESTNPLSPFGKNPIFWKGEKYENMLSVLYNEAIKSIISPTEQTFKGSATKAKSLLQAYNKSEHVIIWFKDKGIEILKEMVTSAAYKQRKEQMSIGNDNQITFLFSRMKKTDLLLEPWVGVIKVENGVPFHSMFIGGWNCAWQVQSS